MTWSPSSTVLSNLSPLSQGVLHFLGSLGQRSEGELYLRIFQSLPRGQFALLVLSREVVQGRAGTLAEQLAFLSQLGLMPSLLLGAVESISPGEVDQFVGALKEVGLVARISHCSSSTSPAELSKLRDQGRKLAELEVHLLVMSEPSEPLLVEVVRSIAPRRVVFLRRAGGIGPHRDSRVEFAPGHVISNSSSGIGVVSLRSDGDDLLSSELLNEEDKSALRRAASVLNGFASVDKRATLSIASPLSLLRELFTVSGDGTLVKLGAIVQSFSQYDLLNQKRLELLLEKSFARHLKSTFWKRPPLQLFVEADYRGVALLEPGRDAAFLSKFGVLPDARGEGLGQELWWALSKSYPAVYWRARANNPINTWYASVCDGMHRSGEWNVYWRGVVASDLPGLIADALGRPIDFGEAALQG